MTGFCPSLLSWLGRWLPDRKRARHGRGGWAEAAHAMAERGEDDLLDAEMLTAFDQAKWES